MEGGGSSQSDPRGEELHTLVRHGEKARVEDLLKDQGEGDPIVDYKLNGETPLHVAARMGNTEIVEVLMKVGRADIHARSRERDTPLHVAAQYGHEGVVDKLLQQGAASDLTVEDRRGDTPLHGAAQSGSDKIVKRMLSLVPNRQAFISAKNGELRTPLHYAAGSGNPKVVALLLDIKEQEGLKEACDEFGAIPFHFAARSGDVKSLERLVPRDVNVESNNGFTALHYAAWNARIDAVKWLMDKGALVKYNHAKDTPLHLAAISKNLGTDKVVENIVAKASESWKMKNMEGELAIGLADTHKHSHVVCAILQSLRRLKPSLEGYDILTPTHEPKGTTLLHYAAGYGTKDDMEWLLTALDKGKKVDDIVDKSSRTPLHWAAMMGNTRTLKSLANAGAELTVMSSRGAGETPLFLALGEAHLDFAEELLKCDKETNKNNSGRRCLTTDEWMEGVDHWMMTYYNDKVEKQVADELKDGFRHHTRELSTTWLPAGNGGAMDVFQEIPPLYLALHAGRCDIAKFFQRLSSDEDAVNKKGAYTGRSALHWAVLFRKRHIVEQLCSKVPEFKERIRVCEEDVHGIAPVQYATEMSMQDIEAELFKREAVLSYIAGLYRDREIYVDSTNAILVGAALIASVTFAGWLQPPLNYVTYPNLRGSPQYAAIQQHMWMRVFWVLNSLSFFAAIGTVQAGACGVLPLRHVHIGRAVIYIRRALMVASLLMALSVACVLGAFSAAGFVVLPPILKFEVYMMSTVGFGGLINACLILWFIQRVLVAPQLLRLWKRHLLGTQSLVHRASPPPDLVPHKAIPSSSTPSPRPSVDQQKLTFPWDDGIEELYPSKIFHT